MAGLLAVVVTACFDDPTSSLRGGATKVMLDRHTVILTPDSTAPVLVYFVDDQGNPVPIGDITLTSANPAVATVVPDTEAVTPGRTSVRVFVTGVSLLGGATTVTATVGAQTATLNVFVQPDNFPGTIANGAGNLLDTIVISGGANASFNANSDVSIGGEPAWVVSRSSSTIKAFAQHASSGTVTITNVTVAGGALTVGALTSTAVLTVNATVGTDATEPANNAPDAVVIAGVETATEANPVYIVGTANDTGDPDDLFAITTTSVGTLHVVLEFFGNGDGGSTNYDHDLFLCDAGCAAFVGVAASADQPEVLELPDLPAGTYNIYVNAWDTGATPGAYRIVVWKN